MNMKDYHAIHVKSLGVRETRYFAVDTYTVEDTDKFIVIKDKDGNIREEFDKSRSTYLGVESRNERTNQNTTGMGYAR